MDKIRCIIVEDEPLALHRTRRYVEQADYLELLQTFSNPFQAIAFLKNTQTDLIFLDIQMNQITGIELLEKLTDPPAVILTTAYEEYAVKAFELNVVDYLLKPFSFDRFLIAVTKARKQITEQAAPEFLFFKSGVTEQKISLSQIEYIEGARDYRKIYYGGKTLLTGETFGELEKRLPNNIFCRVHKSFIVNFTKIALFENERVKVGNEWIPVSDTYRKQLHDVLKR